MKKSPIDLYSEREYFCYSTLKKVASSRRTVSRASMFSSSALCSEHPMAALYSSASVSLLASLPLHLLGTLFLSLLLNLILIFIMFFPLLLIACILSCCCSLSTRPHNLQSTPRCELCNTVLVLLMRLIELLYTLVVHHDSLAVSSKFVSARHSPLISTRLDSHSWETCK